MPGISRESCVQPTAPAQPTTHGTSSRCCSNIRETMVKIMLSPASRQRPASEGGCGEAGQYDACATGGGFGNTLGGIDLHVGPSTCIFWCAVALGALVKGSPIESVSRLLIRGAGNSPDSSSREGSQYFARLIRRATTGWEQNWSTVTPDLFFRCPSPPPPRKHSSNCCGMEIVL